MQKAFTLGDLSVIIGVILGILTFLGLFWRVAVMYSNIRNKADKANERLDKVEESQGVCVMKDRVEKLETEDQKKSSRITTVETEVKNIVSKLEEVSTDTKNNTGLLNKLIGLVEAQKS